MILVPVLNSPITWTLVSPTFPSFTVFFERVPDDVRIETSPSSSDMILTAPSGSRIEPGVFVERDANMIVALCPMYFAQPLIDIRIVERRFAFDTVETALTTPERVVSSICTATVSPIERVLARSGSISSTICGCLLVNSAICDPILTERPTLAITREMIPSTGAVTRSLLASRSACWSAIFAFSLFASSCMSVAVWSA